MLLPVEEWMCTCYLLFFFFFFFIKFCMGRHEIRETKLKCEKQVRLTRGQRPERGMTVDRDPREADSGTETRERLTRGQRPERG